MEGRGVARGRLRWVVLFAILLVASSAVPVLAESPPDQPPEGDFAWATPEEEERLPDAEDIAKGLRELEEQEAEEESWRETPEAESFLDQSQDAFEGVSASEAEDLLEDTFASQLDLIEQDPARALSDAGIKQVLGPTSARIAADGNTMLMEGTAPVRTANEEGELEKVDLDLESEANGFVATNPLVDVSLPEQASGEIQVGEDGFSVKPVVPNEQSSARPQGDEDLFYFEVAKDTDLLLQPISAGVELSAQLRSPESPEELRLEVELPTGANLAPDGDGGAEITREDERIASISAPKTFDALGAEIPTSMRIEGNVLTIEIHHRGGEFAYPALMDPAISEDWYATGKHWYGGNNLWAIDTPGIWVWQTNNGGRFWADTDNSLFGGSGRGLFVSATSTTAAQDPNKYGQWTYTVPDPEDTTWISAAGASPFWRNNGNGNCSVSAYPEPHDFAGLWSLQWSPGYGWVTFRKNDAHNLGHTYHTAPKDWKEKTGEVFILGMGTGNGGAKIPCWRHIYAGGVYIWLEDTENPSIGSPSGVPSGWISDTTQFAVDVPVSDGGLGIQNSTLIPAGNPIINDIATQDQCSGLKIDPCPNSMTAHFGGLDGDNFDEGKTTTQLSTRDALGKVSSTVQWETKVDRTPPEVTLSGQLAQATNEGGSEEQPPGQGDTLSLLAYNLKIEAKDGSNASDASKRSGVKDIEIYLDGSTTEEPVPWEAQSCPAGSCAMTQTYQLKLNDLEAGEHTLEVIAVDQVGKERKREIEFSYVPATGMKDSYVMHYFPLPDGTGNEEEEEFPVRPELAVNVINGNLVYREQDIEVEGPAVDLEVERYYNSLLPEEENTQWGDGWTLAQTPDLAPEDTGGSPAPDEAALRDASGVLAESVQLPSEVGQKSFDPELQATLTKQASGGYELSEEENEAPGAIVFDEGGRAEQLRGPGLTRVDYVYEGEDLTEIAVDDPAKTSLSAEEVEDIEGEEPPPEGPPTQMALHQRSFGSNGTEPGQLQGPADVVRDSEGNLWVADRANHRIQKFGPDGEYLDQFGSYGSADGQLNMPSAIAIDSEGNLWVADRANNRIQRFSPEGEFLSKFGIAGTAEGKLQWPDGIAIDANGDIWVADGVINKRVQKFSPQGVFIERIATSGSGPGQIGNAKGIAIADGKAWIADFLNNRVSVFDEAGEFLFQFGSEGAGDGQFKRPVGIDVDEQGDVWVAEADNDRVQRFDQEGDFLAKFGSPGGGEEQFNLTHPMGIASDGSGGRVWITDTGNHRIQEWLSFEYIPGPEGEAIAGDDPKVEIDVEEGLVSSLAGEEAGEHTYEHEGELLTSYEGPGGETAYDYDEEDRLTGIELPNGTTATVVYDTTYGWVKSVTVDPAGSDPAKTTHFSYSIEPRRTTVTAPGVPVTAYDIGGDGSVLKWWNAVVPPDFDDLAGSLWSERETQSPIPAGDHNLVVQAHSEHGIASIEIIADGNQLISEQTCEQDLEKEGIECVTVVDEWVTSTDMHPPGNLDLEVLITDELGNSASERFWVNIPEPPPPPPPGALVPPKFHDILRFREEYGLEVVFPVANELELNNRIFDLIGAWHNPQTPAGEVARASWERWGIPMRPADVAELEYREWLYDVNAEKIDQWVEATSPGSYAGYYLDHPAGGVMRIGFLGNQAEQLANLEASLSLVGGDSRLSVYPTPPTVPYLSVRATTQSVMDAIESNSTLADLIVSVEDDEAGKATRVGTPNVAQVESILDQMLGPNTPITVEHETSGGSLLSGRFRNRGRMRAGDFIVSRHYHYPNGVQVHQGNHDCTAGFGAKDRAGQVRGHPVWRLFVLTAGHCTGFEVFAKQVFRSTDVDSKNEKNWKEVGEVTRDAFTGVPKKVRTDAEAIKVNSAGIVPQAIFGWGGNPIPTGRAGKVRKGYTVCFSGAKTQRPKCGQVVARSTYWRGAEDGVVRGGYWVKFSEPAIPGDSGAPVWSPIPGSPSVGLVTAGRPEDILTETLVEPLLHPPNMASDVVPGILNNPLLRPLSLKRRR